MKILKMFSNGKCIQLIDRDLVGACFYNDDRISFIIGGTPLSTRVHYSDFLNIVNNWDNEKYDEIYLNSFPELVKEEEVTEENVAKERIALAAEETQKERLEKAKRLLAESEENLKTQLKDSRDQIKSEGVHSEYRQKLVDDFIQEDEK